MPAGLVRAVEQDRQMLTPVHFTPCFFSRTGGSSITIPAGGRGWSDSVVTPFPVRLR